MTYREIIAEIEAGRFAPVYLLMGEETWFLDKIADALEKKVVDEADRDFNQSIFFGADVEMDVLMASAKQFPMMAPNRLVMLKEAQAMTQAKTNLEKIAPYIANPTPTTVLVIVFKGDNLNATSALMKAASTNKKVVVFKSPKLRDYQLSEPIKEFVASRRKSIEPKALSMLMEYVGADLSKLFGEIDKLIVAHKDGENRITAAMVERLIGVSKDYNAFELTNAIRDRDYAKAMGIVDAFSRNPRQKPTVMIIPAVFNFFTRLAIANFTKDQSDSSLMAALQLKTPYALRELRVGMRNFPGTQPVKAIHAIAEFDKKSKGIGSQQKEHELLKELVFRLFTLR